MDRCVEGSQYEQNRYLVQDMTKIEPHLTLDGLKRTFDGFGDTDLPGFDQYLKDLGVVNVRTRICIISGLADMPVPAAAKPYLLGFFDGGELQTLPKIEIIDNALEREKLKSSFKEMTTILEC